MWRGPIVGTTDAMAGTGTGTLECTLSSWLISLLVKDPYVWSDSTVASYWSFCMFSFGVGRVRDSCIFLFLDILVFFWPAYEPSCFASPQAV